MQTFCRKTGCYTIIKKPLVYCPQCTIPDRKPDTRPSAAHRGYNSPRWHRLRAIILSKQPICQLCGKVWANTVDHIVSRDQGGGDEESNLQALCKSCHGKKGYEKDNLFGRLEKTVKKEAIPKPRKRRLGTDVKAKSTD